MITDLPPWHPAPVVRALWATPGPAARAVREEPGFALIVDPGMHEELDAALLETGDGVAVTIRPELVTPEVMSAPPGEARATLARAGVALSMPHLMFYLPPTGRPGLLGEPSAAHVRALTAGDAAAFADFETGSTADEIDDAFVELDHWDVVGAFEGARLAAVASAYPWRGSRIADLGVLTAAEFRGRGHARAVVRELCRRILGRGYEPQYRCDVSNHASAGVARASGLTLYARWDCAPRREAGDA